jgi:HPt (histidine-containing phosphotransfer) domain-containing protein
MRAMSASLHTTRPQPTDALEGAFRAVWDEHREGILTNVSLIERAVTLLSAGQLDEQLRADARRAAHMLSGSLGMFGFAHAAEAAHELQLELDRPQPARAPTLSTLVAIIQRGLGPQQRPPADAQAEEL